MTNLRRVADLHTVMEEIEREKKMDFWVIMDKSKKTIAVGSPRNRELRLLSDAKNVRVMIYGSKAKAESGFKDSGFYAFGEAGVYLKKTYGDLQWKYEDICIAVPAKLVIDGIES